MVSLRQRASLPHHKARKEGAWGYDLFQSDTDLDTVDMLNDSADLNKVEEKIVADRARYSFPSEEKEESSDKEFDADDIEDDDIYMTLYNPSHPDLVQQHLDSGVLTHMINNLRDKGQGNALCLLIACAMQLGCTIPDWCRQELILIYQKCRLPPEGAIRFGKALHEYRNGIPYPFNSKGLHLTVSTGNPSYKESEITWMRLEDVPAGEEITQENTTIERVYGDFNQPVDVCGNCGARNCDDGSPLKRCAGCKERLYCSKTCQKAHTPKHSCLCPGFRKAREEQPADACGNCGAKQAKDGSALKRCARCRNRAYCSVECQKEHYPAHAVKCKAEAEEAKENQNDRRVKGLNVLQTW
ncbi:uncharacterized protein M437DRAFT_80210 [Aureobasidium melanogenum CBS 110374]|uniref:MYND-type domain-containing protein n=1 Tax=Aureobasidium melanogenum (strain CBS 110374) TaxID=1043003 RepID=A0A074WYW9_AURM1|nr:uncharacterized protein M437DRAFT_80210 [Aureobasidium melanogenum CBS 110374]KEQ67566.1 hypothetical protein M437DRAFT_80210 [Aureobasidium melanogenum CBS 110374]